MVTVADKMASLIYLNAVTVLLFQSTLFDLAVGEIDFQQAIIAGQTHFDQIMDDRKSYAEYDDDTTPYSCRWAIGKLHLMEPDAVLLEKKAIIELEATKSILKGDFPPGSTIYDIKDDPYIISAWRDNFPYCYDLECEKQCEDPYYTYYRTADGSCNNEHHRSWGKSFTAQQRLLDPFYDDPFNLNAPRRLTPYGPLPSARFVSTHVFRQNPDLNHDHDTRFTVILMAWGQFLDHDLVLTPTSHGDGGLDINCCADIPGLPYDRPECFPIEIPYDDPYYENRTCMNFVRSAAAVRRDGYCKPSWREQLNQVTSFVDASNVYGSTLYKQRSLRARYGKSHLLLTHGNNFPKANSDDACNLPNPKDLFFCTDAGDERSDEVPNLLFLHTLMLREHNRIADRLKYCWRSQNPYYTSEDEEDEYIFQETRKIIIAIVQQITYKDFLPKILGLKIMDEYNLRVHHDSHNVYNPYLNPSIFNSFGAAAWRMGHSLIPQLQGFNHNEDNTILAYKDQDFERVELIKTFFRPSFLQAGDGRKFGKFARWLVSDRAMKLDGHFVHDIQDRLFEPPGEFGDDLASLNIQRGRDHGLRPYVFWRKFCNIDDYLITNFHELHKTHTQDNIDRFAYTYGNVGDIDLFAGAMTEIPIPGGLLGPTFSCIIGLQFKHLKHGDSFWFERRKMHDKSSLLTEDQIEAIKEWTLAKIICENTGIEHIQKDVFKAASIGTIRKCSDIPDLNLVPWGCQYADGRENLYPDDMNKLTEPRYHDTHHNDL